MSKQGIVRVYEKGLSPSWRIEFSFSCPLLLRLRLIFLLADIGYYKRRAVYTNGARLFAETLSDEAASVIQRLGGMAGEW